MYVCVYVGVGGTWYHGLSMIFEAASRTFPMPWGALTPMFAALANPVLPAGTHAKGEQCRRVSCGRCQRLCVALFLYNAGSAR